MGHAKAQVHPSLSDDRQVYFLLDLVIALDLSHVPIPSQAKIPASSTISVGLAVTCTYTDRLPRLDCRDLQGMVIYLTGHLGKAHDP